MNFNQPVEDSAGKDPQVAWLGRISDAWYRLLCVLLVVAVAVLLLPVTLQIVSRHTELIPTYIWTEELARLMFIWTIMIGAMVGMRERAHFTVDVWPELTARIHAVLELLGGIAILVFATVFVWSGWEFTRFAFARISELAELPLWTIHVAWPILGVTWLLFQAEHMLDMVRQLSNALRAR
jgi:TRAP-type C4-dicarboxylate transport system permease small subunit